MVSNLALKYKATDKTEITVSSGGGKKRGYGCKQSLLSLQLIISDDEKLNFFFLVFRSLEILLLLFVLRSF